jgi:hypothetical protein
MTVEEQAEAAARLDWHDHPALCGPECEGLQPFGAMVDCGFRRFYVLAHVRGLGGRFYVEVSTVRPR